MRGKRASKRKVQRDPKYGSERIAKFINYLMRRGKKNLAQKIVYRTLDLIAQKTKLEPLEVFERAIRNISPLMEVKARRIGGANYQIPVAVEESRKFTLVSRWLIEAAREKKGKTMEEKLAEEILEALENRGLAIKKKENLQRTVEANKAFAYFARFIK